nr:hypothetical protein [Lentzea californiensis]
MSQQKRQSPRTCQEQVYAIGRLLLKLEPDGVADGLRISHSFASTTNRLIVRTASGGQGDQACRIDRSVTYVVNYGAHRIYGDPNRNGQRASGSDLGPSQVQRRYRHEGSVTSPQVSLLQVADCATGNMSKFGTHKEKSRLPHGTTHEHIADTVVTKSPNRPLELAGHISPLDLRDRFRTTHWADAAVAIDPIKDFRCVFRMRVSVDGLNQQYCASPASLKSQGGDLLPDLICSQNTSTGAHPTSGRRDSCLKSSFVVTEPCRKHKHLRSIALPSHSEACAEHEVIEHLKEFFPFRCDVVSPRCQLHASRALMRSETRKWHDKISAPVDLAQQGVLRVKNSVREQLKSRRPTRVSQNSVAGKQLLQN